MSNFNSATLGNYELEKVLEYLDNKGSVGLTTGNVYVVIPSTNANYNEFFNKFQKTNLDGTFLIQPTLTAAMTACTANRGDFIYLAPGFTLTVTSAVPALDKAGVTIVGMGNGLSRPTFTYGAAAATINVSAANIRVLNCHFVANFDNVAAAFTLAAAKDFELNNNTFDDVSTILHYLSIVVTNATDQNAEGLKVVGNRWNGLALAPNAFISILAATDRIVVTDNIVYMDATNDVGHFMTLAAKILLEAEISRNVLAVVGASGATVGIFLTGSGTTSKGVVRGNRVSSLDTTTELVFTAGTGLVYFDNLYTGVADRSGYVLPLIDTSA